MLSGAMRRAAPLFLFAGACMAKTDARTSVETMRPVRGRPDELPQMLNAEPPFRYPVAMYARRAQGNVMLRLFVDGAGRVRPESTRVAGSSGFPSLDSAAVAGSRQLRFSPARRHGKPVALALFFPVYFRHPDADPLPGDSVLRPPPAP
jgi:TonB family protein